MIIIIMIMMMIIIIIIIIIIPMITIITMITIRVITNIITVNLGWIRCTAERIPQPSISHDKYHGDSSTTRYVLYVALAICTVIACIVIYVFVWMDVYFCAVTT